MLFHGCLQFVIVIFFFKQKTAYEMRISDWSSDVCSSDLVMISDITQDIKVANVRLTYLGLIRIRFSTGSSFIRRGSGPGQRQGDERQVAAGLSQCHNAEETPKRFAHHAGDHRERVANNGHPT